MYGDEIHDLFDLRSPECIYIQCTVRQNPMWSAVFDDASSYRGLRPSSSTCIKKEKDEATITGSSVEYQPWAWLALLPNKGQYAKPPGAESKSCWMLPEARERILLAPSLVMFPCDIVVTHIFALWLNFDEYSVGLCRSRKMESARGNN